MQRIRRTDAASRWAAVVLFFVIGATETACRTGKEAPPAEKESTTAAPLSTKAPELFHVRLDTTKGPVDLEVHRDWAPRGADRFYELVKAKFYDDAGFFRVLKGFAGKFGINKDPKVSQLWNELKIVDDQARQK